MWTTSMLLRVFERVGSKTRVPFRVEFADGAGWQNVETEPALTIRFHTPRAQRAMLLHGHIGLLESYFDHEVDIDGDFKSACTTAFEGRYTSPSPLVRLRNLWHEVQHSNRTIARAKANARFHYGLGEEFFKRWLDRDHLMYTCAYWKEGTNSIEEAQRNKIDHVCRKLRLQPGETVADVGCGWGGFMFHAHEHYGAKPTGYNATTEQVRELEWMLERRGLGDEMRVHERDHREVDGQFDKVAHIGVLEHAGKGQIREGVAALARCVKPRGLGVLHFIGHVGRFDTEYFIREHIFPGGWIPSLAETIEEMERCGLEVLDIENLRRHYALTLDAWAERFDEHWDEIHALDPSRFDERFRRKWRVYLYGSAEMFRSRNGYTHLFQITFSKGNVDYDHPMSRSYMYAGDGAGG